MFWTRTLSGIVLLIILGFVFISGGNILLGFLGIISLVGLYEYYKAVGLIAKEQITQKLTTVGYIGCAIMYLVLLVSKGNLVYMFMVPAVVIIATLAVYVFSFPAYRIEQIALAIFGFCYVPVLLSFIYHTRALQDGIYIVWLIFMSSWICDIFAYCVGMLFGKHKLAPVLSPKKSIEGSVGGVVFSAIFGGVYGYIVQGHITAAIPVVATFVVVSAVGACVSQIGDLAASAIKRNFDIKDYGHLIPGHGGILDRFDSMIFTAPMVYLVALLFMI